MSITEFFRWFPTRGRIMRDSRRLYDRFGERAIGLALTRRWFAQSDGQYIRSAYWKYVIEELARLNARELILKKINLR